MTLKEQIYDLVTSKKFIALLAGVVITLAAKFQIAITEETATQLVGLLMAYIVGQGIADVGKEAKKIETKNNE